MDFANALLLSALLFALVKLEGAVYPPIEMSRRLTVIAVIVSSFVATFGLRYSVWGDEQVVGGHPLDKLNFGSLVVVAIFLAAGAAFVHEAVKAVKNIGDNQPQKPIAK